MSKFFKALEQAERDLALRTGASGGASSPYESLGSTATTFAPLVPAPTVPARTEEESTWPSGRVVMPLDDLEADLVGADPASAELQQLWFAMLRRRAWSSLVVIPAQPGVSVVPTARGLGMVAERHLRKQVTVIVPGELYSLDELPTVMPALAGPVPNELLERAVRGNIPDDSIRTPPGHAERADRPKTPSVIVALEPVIANPLGIAVTLAADVALLCVVLGETSVASAKRTVELVGRERFIGCVVQHARSRPS